MVENISLNNQITSKSIQLQNSTHPKKQRLYSSYTRSDHSRHFNQPSVPYQPYGCLQEPPCNYLQDLQSNEPAMIRNFSLRPMPENEKNCSFYAFARNKPPLLSHENLVAIGARAVDKTKSKTLQRIRQKAFYGDSQTELNEQLDGAHGDTIGHGNNVVSPLSNNEPALSLHFPVNQRPKTAHVQNKQKRSVGLQQATETGNVSTTDDLVNTKSQTRLTTTVLKNQSQYSGAVGPVTFDSAVIDNSHNNNNINTVEHQQMLMGMVNPNELARGDTVLQTQHGSVPMNSNTNAGAHEAGTITETQSDFSREMAPNNAQDINSQRSQALNIRDSMMNYTQLSNHTRVIDQSCAVNQPLQRKSLNQSQLHPSYQLQQQQTRSKFLGQHQEQYDKEAQVINTQNKRLKRKSQKSLRNNQNDSSLGMQDQFVGQPANQSQKTTHILMNNKLLQAGENVTSFGVVQLYNNGFFPTSNASKKSKPKGNPYKFSTKRSIGSAKFNYMVNSSNRISNIIQQH